MQGFGATPQAQAADPFPQKEATPEQQEQYNQFYANCVKVLFSDQFLEKGADLLQSSPTVVDGMARIGSGIGMRVYTAAMDAGQMIEPIVLVEAGREIMGEVAEFAKALGHKVSEEDAEDAYLMASDMMRNMMEDSGILDREAFDQEIAEHQDKFDMSELQPFLDRQAKAKEAVTDSMMKGIKS